MKKFLSVLLMLSLLAAVLSGCGQEKKQVYQAMFVDVFDTITTLRGYDVSQEAFDKQARQTHEALLAYHNLFDIYADYPGGLKQINDNAGIAPVEAAPEVIALLRDCRDFYTRTDGRVNVAMGSVLSLWHDAREAGLNDPAHAALPDKDALEAAVEHVRFDTVKSTSRTALFF